MQILFTPDGNYKIALNHINEQCPLGSFLHVLNHPENQRWYLRSDTPGKHHYWETYPESAVPDEIRVLALLLI